MLSYLRSPDCLREQKAKIGMEDRKNRCPFASDEWFNGPEATWSKSKRVAPDPFTAENEACGPKVTGNWEYCSKQKDDDKACKEEELQEFSAQIMKCCKFKSILLSLLNIQLKAYLINGVLLERRLFLLCSAYSLWEQCLCRRLSEQRQWRKDSRRMR